MVAAAAAAAAADPRAVGYPFAVADQAGIFDDEVVQRPGALEVT